MHNRFPFVAYVAAILVIAGCGRGPRRVKQADVDPQAAADEAISLYDSSGDGLLDEVEMRQSPGILYRLNAYDTDGDKKVSGAEIASRLKARADNRVAMMSVKCVVTVNGKPLPNAEVVFEPEAYLGDDYKTAYGTTNSAGMCSISIPKEELPSALQHLNAIYVGTYKVRITHPELSLPAKYNTETELGYETETGQMYAKFDLKLGRKK